MGAQSTAPRLVEAELFGEPRELVERLAALPVQLVPIGDDVGELHAPMAADLMVRELAALEELDEIGPRDAQEIGRLLRRELGLFGEQDGAGSLGEMLEGLDEHAEGARRERDRDRPLSAWRAQLKPRLVDPLGFRDLGERALGHIELGGRMPDLFSLIHRFNADGGQSQMQYPKQTQYPKHCSISLERSR